MENDADFPALIRMSPDGFADFLRLIEKPPEAVPAIVELFKRKAPWEEPDSEVSIGAGN